MRRARLGAAPEASAVEELAALEDVLEDARGRLTACLRLLGEGGPGLRLVPTTDAAGDLQACRTG